MKDIAGAKGLTVKRCKFENIGTAVHSDWSGSSGFYIADNDMLGREDRSTPCSPGMASSRGWIGPDFAERGKLKSFYAVSIYGQGHVMAYNRVRGFHDGLDHATYGMPDDYPNTPRDRLPVAIDIYNNDVSVVHDNCFETDGAVRNIRVLRNRCFNAVLGAMSPQPDLRRAGLFHSQRGLQRVVGAGEDSRRALRHLLPQQHLRRRVQAAHARCRTCTCATT